MCTLFLNPNHKVCHQNGIKVAPKDSHLRLTPLAQPDVVNTIDPAQGPATSEPSGRLITGFDAPGQFPDSVTATNVNIAPLPGVEFGGAGEDLLASRIPLGWPDFVDLLALQRGRHHADNWPGGSAKSTLVPVHRLRR